MSASSFGRNRYAVLPILSQRQQNSARTTAWANRMLIVESQPIAGCRAPIRKSFSVAASTVALERTVDWSDCCCLCVESSLSFLDLARFCRDGLPLWERVPVPSLMSSELSIKSQVPLFVRQWPIMRSSHWSMNSSLAAIHWSPAVCSCCCCDETKFGELHYTFIFERRGHRLRASSVVPPLPNERRDELRERLVFFVSGLLTISVKVYHGGRRCRRKLCLRRCTNGVGRHWTS